MVPGVRLSRVYLIEGDELVAVDSGLPWSASKVINYIASIGRNPHDLTRILMTHSHPDHASGAWKLQRVTGAKIVAHAGDAKMHSHGETTLHYMGMFGSRSWPVPFFRRVPVAELINGIDVVPVSPGIVAIPTPGHTSGSVCYLVEDRRILFSGDTAFSNGRNVSRSLPFPGSDRRTYRQSLEHLASLDFDALCGGHGQPLKTGASGKLRDLLAASPDPPSWGGLARRLFWAGIGRKQQ